ncbi:MAG: aminotransferase class V-fold PLP-dependent enzyme [Peptococcaceae bacterium]|jgi:cysteine desulfurase family protein|nr:aminotransferase class V-fold PLP-dependent enzyme [Peptococcaceae bacterium]
MNRVYFDQAATSFPKAPGVGDAMKYYLENVGANINRGVYTSALSAEEIVLETREALCRLFHFQKPQNVIFTMNITHSLNMLLKGLLKPDDHCIVSSMEHNAVMRPLLQLDSLGISFTRVKANSQGFLDPQDLKNVLQENTKAVIMTHASNVCGTILPLKEIGEICKSHGLIFMVDSAQTAGSLTIDLQDYNIDALAFTGHKGLLGPQGIGGFLISPQLAQEMDPLLVGGTGSLSDREHIPPFLPDKFEAGTPNIPGIFGLHRALSYLEKEGIESLQARAMELTGLFLEGVHDLKNIKLIGPPGLKGRTAVVSLDFKGKDNGEIAYLLEKDYGIMTRSGLHCAPSAHQTLGTFPQGTVRFSFNHFNTTEEINYALQALAKISK